jgi:hypothetical protein
MAERRSLSELAAQERSAELLRSAERERLTRTGSRARPANAGTPVRRVRLAAALVVVAVLILGAALATAQARAAAGERGERYGPSTNGSSAFASPSRPSMPSFS